MLIFRCDTNRIIASGHLMRCLSIADAAVDLGIDVVFVSSDGSGEDIIKGRGYNNYILNTQWNDLDSEIDCVCVLVDSLIKGYRNEKNIMIVDSYYASSSYLKKLKEHILVAYMDDFGKEVYPVDYIICYAIYAKGMDIWNKYNNTQLLLGMDYVPLRKAFNITTSYPVRMECDCLLIMSGGSDEYSVIKKLLDSIDENDFERIYAICGLYNKDYDDLLLQYSNDNRIHIVKNTNNVSDYMKKADVVISAAGSTLYELCAIGAPTISYVIADNQLQNAYYFDREGLIPYAGDAREIDTINKIIDMLKAFTYEKRIEYNNQMMKYRIRTGATNIVRTMLES
ncbi:MAG: UDP-2,4-diacetamido-2,4,6-trideoxy-beta-L-altropyranose hydrolase [Pseudobutyrivibrio sp.]|nr:UDP-2,4-diacetamido-2,4,6-trideoxy-beta-L-altropyranose hydrolase [Pseudobutyrivibrio sp.]